MRHRVAFLVGVLVLASCAESVPPEPPSTALLADPAQSSPGATGSPKVAGEPKTADDKTTGTTAGPAATATNAEPSLPALVRDARKPCDIARARRDRAKDLLASGRAYRALRELGKADQLCAAEAARGWKTKLDALDKLGRTDDTRALARLITDAPDADADTKKAARDITTKTPAGSSQTGAALIASAEAAKARGDAAETRRLFDQALARLEQEASGKASLVWVRQVSTPLALSADGATAVLARETMAVLADAARLAPLRFFDHGRAVRAAALSRDRRLVATVDDEGSAFVWSAATGKRIQKLSWSGERATSAAFSPDSKRLVVVSGPSFDTAARIWNVETGDSVAAFTSSGVGQLSSFALSRDDKLMAIGTERGHLEIWSIGPKPKSAFVLTNRESFLESVVSVAFSSKGDRLAAVFENGSAGVWDTANGKQVWLTTTQESFQNPGTCAFAADGKRVLAGWAASRSGSTLRVWDAVTGAELQNKPAPGRAMAFSEDAKRALLDGESSLTLLDVNDMTTMASLSNKSPSAEHVLFGPPRVLAVDLDRDESLRVLLPTGLRTLPLAESHRMVVPSLDGKTVAVSIHGEITLWDLENARARERLLKLDFFPRSIAMASDGSVRATDAFTKLILVTSGSPRAGWKTVFSRPRGDKGFPSLFLSTFGRRAVAVMENEVGVIDADSGQARVIDHGLSDVDSATLTPDGRTALIIEDERLARFDAATGGSLGPPAALGCRSRDLSMSFDGSRVATACNDGARVLTFDGSTMSASTQIPCGRSTKDVALSPHGDLLVSAHDDGRVRLWAVDDGRSLGEIRFLSGLDAAIVEAPDGRVELLGGKAGELERELICRVGGAAYPFELCREALTEEGLLAELLAPR